MDTDEFEIKATGTDMQDRVWTRSTMGAACSIADQAVDRLGYQRAEVVNTYGGHRSDTLYVKVEMKNMKKDEVPEFIKEMNQLFADQMSRLPIKKKALEDMKAGFSDGVRICLHMLQEKGHLKID